MVVVEPRQIWRNVRHKIPVVNHPVNPVQFLGHVLSQFDVSQSRLSEVVDLHFGIGKRIFHFDCTYCRDSCAQAVSGCDYAGRGVLGQQLLHFGGEGLFEEEPVDVEAGVDEAVFAPEVCHFFEVGVFDPVGCIAASPEGEHHLIVPGIVGHISCCLCDGMLQVQWLFHGNSLSSPTRPSLHAGFAAESDGCQFGQLLRSSDVVGRRRQGQQGGRNEQDEQNGYHLWRLNIINCSLQCKISKHHWPRVVLYAKLAEHGAPFDESLQLALIFILLGMPAAQSAKQVY